MSNSSLLATRRVDGAFLELVPSASQPGAYHLVDPINRTCDCRGFSYRGRCSHLFAIAPSAPAELLQSEYAKAQGDPAPRPVRVPLVARLKA